MALFYRDSIENPQFGGSKVQAFQGQLSGRVPPPPSSVRCFDPPLSRFPNQAAANRSIAGPKATQAMFLATFVGAAGYDRSFLCCTLLQHLQEGARLPWLGELVMLLRSALWKDNHLNKIRLFELPQKWGCNRWGLKGCLASLPAVQAFFALFLPFSPFSAGSKRRVGNQKKGGKKVFPQMSWDFLNPHFLTKNICGTPN